MVQILIIYLISQLTYEQLPAQESPPLVSPMGNIIEYAGKQVIDIFQDSRRVIWMGAHYSLYYLDKRC